MLTGHSCGMMRKVLFLLSTQTNGSHCVFPLRCHFWISVNPFLLLALFLATIFVFGQNTLPPAYAQQGKPKQSVEVEKSPQEGEPLLTSPVPEKDKRILQKEVPEVTPPATAPRPAPPPVPVHLSKIPLKDGPEPRILLEKMDFILRGSSHDMTVTMEVKTSRWERHYRLRVWMEGVDYAFARVLEPPKVEGQGFLRIKSRLWNYLPTAERTILIPPSMMLDRFMGSDFSNDDFIKLSYLPRDYDGVVVAEERLRGYDVYHLVLRPRPEAPVTYGKLEVWLRAVDAAPLKVEFYNERMEHIRTLDYSDFRSFGGHEIPTIWRMENIQEPDRQTVITILEAKFGLDVPDEIFTRANLEKYP